MRSTTWIAVLATSPVSLEVLTVLLVLIRGIVAISDHIAYYEMHFDELTTDLPLIEAEKLEKVAKKTLSRFLVPSRTHSQDQDHDR